MNPLSALYGTLARARRNRYERHPHRRRRLHRPVISVGNLVVGGSGKTPVVAAIARLLKEAGERPVILSRGYARRARSLEPVIVSDASRVLEGVERSGDEPQMLARALPGVPVIVCADRHAAGLVAQEHLHASVLLLDDAFQHLALARDVDLLVMSASDLDEPLLPIGRLREPLSTARAAHAIVVRGGEDDARRVASAVGVETTFRVDVAYEALRRVAPFGRRVDDDAPRRVIAVAGIAGPERFFAAVRDQGFEIAREWRFRDHYWFTGADVGRIAESMRALGADLVVTTEKDAVRLERLLAGLASPEPALRTAAAAHTPEPALRTAAAADTPEPAPAAVPWAFLPMRATIEPQATFRSWLMARLAAARAAAEQHA